MKELSCSGVAGTVRLARRMSLIIAGPPTPGKRGTGFVSAANLPATHRKLTSYTLIPKADTPRMQTGPLFQRNEEFHHALLDVFLRPGCSRPGFCNSRSLCHQRPLQGPDR